MEDANQTCANEVMKFSETDALQKFMKTEEVGRFRKAIGRTGRRINTIPSRTPCCPDDCWWGFQVGSTSNAQFVTEFDIQVQAVTGEIQIYDQTLQHYVDYESWRERRP